VSASRLTPHASRARGARGFTVVELAIVAAMIAILTAMVVPIARYTVKRQKELELKDQLRFMRNAIDKYKQYSDNGVIRIQLGSEGYPPDLDTLVDGVPQIGQINKKLKFLRQVPIDPMTGKAEWGLRSFQDEPDSIAWGGQNIYDVHSLSGGRAIDGSYYKDW
jgi:general secretion pathway protein G